MHDRVSRDLGQPTDEGEFRVCRHSSRQGKDWHGRRAGTQDQERAIPIISDVEGFMAYYVVYAPDHTVTAISIFNDYAGAEESNRRVLAWIEENLAPCSPGQPPRWPDR